MSAVVYTPPPSKASLFSTSTVSKCCDPELKMPPPSPQLMSWTALFVTLQFVIFSAAKLQMPPPRTVAAVFWWTIESTMCTVPSDCKAPPETCAVFRSKILDCMLNVEPDPTYTAPP